MELVFASSNENKIREINALMPDGFVVKGLKDVGITEEIPETGSTIKENSLIKARYVFEHLQKTGKLIAVFADDSGLEVTELNNEPGVYSARYAGVPKSDKANNEKLLSALQNTNTRQARFVTVITLINNYETINFEGEIKGTIAREARGSNGFGYDPLFIPQGYRSTFGELGPEVKNTISHRALAVNRLITYLKML